MAEFQIIKTCIFAHRVVHGELPLVGIVAHHSAPAAICYERGRRDLLLGGGRSACAEQPASRSVTARAIQRCMIAPPFYLPAPVSILTPR